MIFRDRKEGGEVLASLLRRYANRGDVVVLALPRGGVPVGYELARSLDAPLDVFVVRKLGTPGHEELAMGALASGNVRVLNHEVLSELAIPPEMVDRVTEREQQELARRERLYRGDRPPLDIRGRTAILTDDGVATGSTMQAGVMALRRLEPERIVVAVPVASWRACEDLGRFADEVVCPQTPEPFYAVGAWYDDFTQTTDEEVRELLDLAAAASHGAARH